LEGWHVAIEEVAVAVERVVVVVEEVDGMLLLKRWL
jgi:hypothetical protein